MRIVLVPVGSAGDVHPHLGLGAALRARGHEVAVLTSPHFARPAAAAGLRLIPWGTIGDYETVTRHPRLWHTRRGIEVIAEALRLGLPEMYRLIEEEARAGDLVLVAHGLAFGARLAHETLGLPLVTVHLQPACFHSVHDAPILHPWLESVNELPLGVKRVLFTVIDRLSDRIFGRAVDPLRAAHGRSPVRRIASHWWHSPQQVIGLFPRWLAPPQPDWPAHTTLTGFPLFDPDPDHPTATEITRFLDAGPPPLVFVAGSGNRHAARFFRTAVEACVHLGRRGLLLTPYAEQLPTPRPPTVRAAAYVPLRAVLPRAGALVHHGGIGTAAQGLAHGVPQVIMPMTFDQPDNAHRLAALGVARTIRPRSFRGPQVAEALDALLGDRLVAGRCRELARRIADDDPLPRTCALVEQMG